MRYGLVDIALYSILYPQIGQRCIPIGTAQPCLLRNSIWLMMKRHWPLGRSDRVQIFENLGLSLGSLYHLKYSLVNVFTREGLGFPFKISGPLWKSYRRFVNEALNLCNNGNFDFIFWNRSASSDLTTNPEQNLQLSLRFCRIRAHSRWILGQKVELFEFPRIGDQGSDERRLANSGLARVRILKRCITSNLLWFAKPIRGLDAEMANDHRFWVRRNVDLTRWRCE
jgi:hypothetical protein